MSDLASPYHWEIVGGVNAGRVSARFALEPGWTLEATALRDDQGHCVLTSLLLRRDPDSNAVPVGITSWLWRRVNVGAVSTALSRLLSLNTEADRQDEWIAEISGRWPAPGRSGHSDERYAKLAYMYVLLVARGSQAPKVELAKHMECSVSTVDTRLQETRRRGLLTQPATGRSGGQLTAKAEQILGIDVPEKIEGQPPSQTLLEPDEVAALLDVIAPDVDLDLPAGQLQPKRGSTKTSSQKEGSRG